jgi:hypothetical protein
MTVFNPSLPPLNCRITKTLFPGGTKAGLSIAFKNFGKRKDAVTSDPVCRKSLRRISMEKNFWVIESGICLSWLFFL